MSAALKIELLALSPGLSTESPRLGSALKSLSRIAGLHHEGVVLDRKLHLAALGDFAADERARQLGLDVALEETLVQHSGEGRQYGGPMLVQGNALHLPSADRTVQLCITSPP